MNLEEREEIMKAINKMIKVFEKSLDWDLLPLLRIEVRELRRGDFSLGESIIVDQIKEYQNAIAERLDEIVELMKKKFGEVNEE